MVFGGLSLGWFSSLGPGRVQGSSALLLSVVVTVVLLGACAVLASEPVLVWAAHRTGWPLIAVRGEVLTCFRRSWFRLVLSSVGYLVLLGVLLDLCLRGLGATQSALLATAVVGIERMVTTVPLTPGGAGAAELTIFTCLTAAGIEAPAAFAAALLYRFFTFLLEIPVGAVTARLLEGVDRLSSLGERLAYSPPKGSLGDDRCGERFWLLLNRSGCRSAAHSGPPGW